MSTYKWGIIAGVGAGIAVYFILVAILSHVGGVVLVGG